MNAAKLVADARARVGNTGYWYGTYLPQVGTEVLLQAKAKQYPTRYTPDYILRSRKWMGKPVCDCAGLIKGLYWISDFGGKYQSATDLSANGLMARCTTSGPVSEIPEIPGILLWKEGHVGVYVGGGMAVESRGVDYGVVLTAVADRGWTKWGKIGFIEYESAPDWEAKYNEAVAQLASANETIRLRNLEIAAFKQQVAELMEQVEDLTDETETIKGTIRDLISYAS